MVYTPQTWADLPSETTPLSASRLQYIEDGIAELGEWTAFTPTWNNLTVGNGTTTGRYTQIGKTIFVQSNITFGSTTAITGTVSFNNPVDRTGTIVSHYGLLFDSSASAVYQTYPQGSGQTMIVRASVASATYVTYTNLSSTVPFTWATSDLISIGVVYETV